MNVVIVGAGPAGLFLAERLLALGSNYRVQLYDCNQNPTDLVSVDSRGFGLGLGARVQNWLSSIEGLVEQLTDEGIEFARGGLILIPRRQLCALLLQSLLTHHGDQVDSRLSINYNTSVIEVDLARHQITIDGESGSQTVAYDLLVGADGVHSTIRSTMMVAKPDEIRFQERQRPHVWKVLQLSLESELQQLSIIRLQTRRPPFSLVFGACLPQKKGRYSALIFWQPSSSDQMNPCGVTTPEELQQLLQEMSPKHSPKIKLDRDQAVAFLAAQPGHEYWSQCHCYHYLEGQAVLIGDAAHGMFSLLGQGCTAAIADAVTLSTLLHQYPEQWSIVLPQYSMQQVKEGHAASDLSLIALIFYHRWLGLLYKVATLLWLVIFRQPSIFARINQVNANYVQVLHENRLWIWLAKKIKPVED
ncbi:NAD(P)/FAD-dependent oxidoreductase [Leptolyngbya sp. FACHB-261]|uniref:FAD-dependent oxidoreductase n=1 Tax=Leptolyngbya sp. FACHB-261 TaxID=2692806 RepID=UPI00168436E2|nr:NAD(P)/FAD-dependent oxidoreductase [Leptolyngbya sp. FACHB-261]MBD2101377.1 FAD-dependent monooxygenase [Leptolyngbya sp. FACHB-261]